MSFQLDYQRSKAIVIRDRIEHFSKPATDAQYQSLLNDEMIFESCTLEDINNTLFADQIGAQSEMILESMRVPKAERLRTTMLALAKSLDKVTSQSGIPVAREGVAGGSNRASGQYSVQISKPVVRGMVAVVTGKINFADGQSISIAFHAPDDDPLKINPTDTLFAFRFLLNSRDVTHIVSSDNGKDISLTALSTWLGSLVAKNSQSFTAKKTQKAAEKLELDNFEANFTAAEERVAKTFEQLSQVEEGIADKKQSLIDIQARIDSENKKQERLRAEIEQLTPPPATKAADVGTPANVAGGQASNNALNVGDSFEFDSVRHKITKVNPISGDVITQPENSKTPLSFASDELDEIGVVINGSNTSDAKSQRDILKAQSAEDGIRYQQEKEKQLSDLKQSYLDKFSSVSPAQLQFAKQHTFIRNTGKKNYIAVVVAPDDLDPNVSLDQQSGSTSANIDFDPESKKYTVELRSHPEYLASDPLDLRQAKELAFKISAYKMNEWGYMPQSAELSPIPTTGKIADLRKWAKEQGLVFKPTGDFDAGSNEKLYRVFRKGETSAASSKSLTPREWSQSIGSSELKAILGGGASAAATDSDSAPAVNADTLFKYKKPNGDPKPDLNGVPAAYLDPDLFADHMPKKDSSSPTGYSQSGKPFVPKGDQFTFNGGHFAYNGASNNKGSFVDLEDGDAFKVGATEGFANDFAFEGLSDFVSNEAVYDVLLAKAKDLLKGFDLTPYYDERGFTFDGQDAIMDFLAQNGIPTYPQMINGSESAYPVYFARVIANDIRQERADYIDSAKAQQEKIEAQEAQQAAERAAERAADEKSAQPATSYMGRKWNSERGEVTVVEVSEEKNLVAYRYGDRTMVNIASPAELEKIIRVDEANYRSKVEREQEAVEADKLAAEQYEMKNPNLNAYLEQSGLSAPLKAKAKAALEKGIYHDGEFISEAMFVNKFVDGAYAADGTTPWINTNYATPAKYRWNTGKGSFFDKMSKSAFEFAKYLGVNTQKPAKESNATDGETMDNADERNEIKANLESFLERLKAADPIEQERMINDPIFDEIDQADPMLTDILNEISDLFTEIVSR